MHQTTTRATDAVRRAVFYACVVLVTAWITATLAGWLTSGMAEAIR